jgi:hypothetical protein
MNEDGDIFMFPNKNSNQLELDIDDEITIDLSDMDDSITITASSPSLTTMHHGLSSLGATGASGAVLTTSLSGSLNWATAAPTISTGGSYTLTSPNYTYDTITLNGSNAKDHALTVKGDATFEGNLKIKGVDLTERLDAIEQRLGILRPNNDLEGKWEKLKALGEEYRKLEQEILEGENIWDILQR